MNRLNNIMSHLNGEQVQQSTLSAQDCSSAAPSSVPVRWNGWGFNDTEFFLNSNGAIELSGSRYLFSGKVMPNLRSFFEAKAGLDVQYATPSQKEPSVPEPIKNEAFLNAIKGQYKQIDFSDKERLFHAHGHTCQEIYMLRFGKFPRVPDVVVYPSSHEQVEAIVKAATQHNVVIIPYGGGTTVSQSLMCPENEQRMIVSLDMHCMNRIKWINKQSMQACIEAGIVGRDLERQLKAEGVVMGHEPDSIEFSTLGGWIATRASGMRKNKYGNIEDIIQHVRLVTPTGTMERGCAVPRISSGPDINNVIMGSEGTLGVITEAIVRLRPCPETTTYGSVIFPNFELGVQCLHDVALQRAAPVSIRLVDNLQFQFGMVLKPPVDQWLHNVTDKVKKWYVTQHLKFDPDQMVAATLLFEGTKSEIAAQEKKVYEIAAKYGGVKAGSENGIRGYFLTYMIAYLRDFGFNYSFIAESFETTVPWEHVSTVCSNVKQRIRDVAKACGCAKEPFVSCRVTQTYDTGACIYFYFGFMWQGLQDPVATFSVIEHEARAEIMKYGGSISHHHGIGKLRSEFMPAAIGNTGINLLKGIKQTLDPQNIFASGNLIPSDKKSHH